MASFADSPPPKEDDESVKEEHSPPPIPSFDWNNLYHRTSLVSCLVKGVYRMERNRQGSVPPAEIWWKCFGFTLCEPLIDAKDDSIYGAVFKNVDNYQDTPNSKVSPPRYVIAFRGMILRKKMGSDLNLGIRCVLQNLHKGPRYEQALQEVKNYVDKYGKAAVWIAGHSLGAGLALLVGKTMALSGSPVEAYLFNPPVISFIRLEQLILRDVGRAARDFLKAFIAVILHLNEGQEYKKLASWRPYLFVNKSDPICSAYIAYFNNVRSKPGILRDIESLARYSIRNSLFGGAKSSSPHHLYFLMSASMMVKTDKQGSWPYHGINHWWNPELESISYQVNVFEDEEEDTDRDRQEEENRKEQQLKGIDNDLKNKMVKEWWEDRKRDYEYPKLKADGHLQRMQPQDLEMLERIFGNMNSATDDGWDGYVPMRYFKTATQTDVDEADMGDEGSGSTEIPEILTAYDDRRSEAITSAEEGESSTSNDTPVI